jgi:uncharacterized protein DUF4145
MKVFCHQCGRNTNHTIIAQETAGSGDDDFYAWAETHYFARCAGCDAFTYAVESSSEDDWNPQTGEKESTWKTYPRGETERQSMADEGDLPIKVLLIYKEVIGAMNAQLPVLSGIGLRALIEAVCKDQKIAGDNLEKLIQGLATNGVLARAQADILHTHRFLGNVAAHEIMSAQPRELVAALEIAENILRTIYVLPELSKQVKTGRRP